MSGERPCHISDAWGREFEQLVRYVRGHITASGDTRHAEFIAAWVARLSGHDGAAILRCAIADAQVPA